MIDLNLYQNHQFHKDAFRNKQIRALIVLCNYEVARCTDYRSKLNLIQHWITIMIQYEMYEVVPYIKQIKGQIIRANKPKKSLLKRVLICFKWELHHWLNRFN